MSHFIFDHLKSINLPDVIFSSGHMTNINVTILEPENPEDIQFCLNPKKNSIVMAVDELDARIQGDFEVKVLGIHVTGIAYVNITDMEFDIELRM